jgi:hypothetical protein
MIIENKFNVADAAASKVLLGFRVFGAAQPQRLRQHNYKEGPTAAYSAGRCSSPVAVTEAS